MDNKELMERINQLARKQKAEGLSMEELEEQARLRKEYLTAFREGMRATLENIWIENEDGVYEKLQRKQ